MPADSTPRMPNWQAIGLMLSILAGAVTMALAWGSNTAEMRHIIDAIEHMEQRISASEQRIQALEVQDASKGAKVAQLIVAVEIANQKLDRLVEHQLK